MQSVDLTLTESPFGGAWLTIESAAGFAWLIHQFGDDAIGPLAPLGGKHGVIIEPYALCDAVQLLSESSIKWESK